jgi:hypothetical protein
LPNASSTISTIVFVGKSECKRKIIKPTKKPMGTVNIIDIHESLPLIMMIGESIIICPVIGKIIDNKNSD